MEPEEIYTAMSFIFQCNICGQLYPVWMVSEKDWEKGITAANAIYHCYVKRSQMICKPCFEEGTPNPKYLTLDEYINQYCPKISKKYREILTNLWEMPNQYTKEEHENVLECLYGEVGQDHERHITTEFSKPLPKNASFPPIDGTRNVFSISELFAKKERIERNRLKRANAEYRSVL
jgi:hypothetical protein